MNFESGQKTTIYNHTLDGKKLYYLSLKRKDRNNNEFTGFINCQFRTGIIVENKSNIIIKKAFLSFYLKDDKTIPFIMILDFDYYVKQEIQKDND